MNEIRKAIKTAMSDPKLIARAVKDAAEGMARNAVYDEVAKMREEKDARASKSDKAPSDSPSVAPAAPRAAAAPMTAGDLLARATRR